VSESSYPAQWESDALLTDGVVAHFRPIRPDDEDRLRDFHAHLSPESVYFRYFAPYPVLRNADVVRFTHVDHVDRVAFVAVIGDEIVGVGRFDRLTDPAEAEVAFVVRDDLQGHGIGTILLDRLAHAGRERGVHRFVAEVLLENVRMRSLFADSGFSPKATFDDGYLTMEFTIDHDQANSSTSSSGSLGVGGIASP
jgi:RimJ/RimL family protein N-acetyltransferase